MLAERDPTHPDQMTADWLTQRLAPMLGGARVTSFTTKPVGEGVGMMGVIARAYLTYDRQTPNAPATVIAKFPASNEGNRAIGNHFRIYEREVLFYDQIAPALGICPGCYAGGYDAETGWAYLLLEDLHDYRTGDQVAGCGVEDGEAIIDALAKLHARYWNRTDDPSLAWAPRIDSDLTMDGMDGAAPTNWQACVERFGHAMAPELIASRDRFLASVRPLHKLMAQRTLTLVHGDCRLDNMMFARRPGQRPVALLDWAPNRAPATQDLAYILCQNLRIEERRQHERRFIELYHQRLLANGVSGYSLDDLWEDYRVAVLYSLVYCVIVAGALDPGNERGRQFMEQLVVRTSAVLTDHDLLRRLPV